MRKPLLLFLLLTPLLCLANFDSLWTVWQSPNQPDSNRLQAIYSISWSQYLFSNPDTAYILASEHLNYAKEVGDKNHMGNALTTQGVSFYIRANYYEAIKHYHKALSIFESIDVKVRQAQLLNNIGLIYKELEEPDTALKYYHQSLAIKELLDDKQGIASSYTNIGNIYNQKNDTAKALEFHFKSLALKRAVDEKKGIAVSLNNIGTILQSKGNLADAIPMFQEALEIFELLNHQKGLAGTYNNLASSYYGNNEVKKAINYGLKGLKIANELSLISEIREASYILYQCYKQQHQLDRALKMHEQFITFKDSANNEIDRKKVIRQEYEYLYEKQKVLDDAAHEKALAIEQKAKEKQTIITYATIVVLILVAVFLFIIFNRLKLTRKQKSLIEDAHHQLEEKNKEIIDSINYAKRIQKAILPPDNIAKECLKEHFILYKPKDIVAGDFYWIETSPELVLFAAADCTGHGVPGAMVSVICNNGLNRSVREHGLTEPGKILDKTREIVIQEFEKSEEEVKDGMDIALCSLQLKSPLEGGERGMTLKYAGAHNPLWVVRPNRHYAPDAESHEKKKIADQASNDAFELIEIKANKQPIGKFDHPEPYTTHTLTLQKNDTIYIFSDGFADQFGGAKGKKFKTANFKKLLLSIQTENMEEQKKLIDKAFENWKGEIEQLDDVCVIGVRI